MNHVDNRLFHWIPLGLVGFVLTGYLLGGAWNWLAPAAIFGGLTLLDLVLGEKPRQFDEQTARRLDKDRSYYLPIYVYVLVHFALLGWGLHVIQQGELNFWHAAGFTISVGVITGGVGITSAHELGHRHSWYDVLLARLLLTSVCYMHFHIEHNKGHHSLVGTPSDPASARYGESLYRFLPRTLVGSFRSALAIERRRLAQEGGGPLKRLNAIYLGIGASLLFALTAFIVAGWAGLLFFFSQAAVAILLLEIVNYVEHYGLERKPLGDGGYEKINLDHSWNSSHRLSNYLLFNLQRHSHHHIHQGRRYQSLQDYGESPQLPVGYTGMALLALVPPVWFAVMNPKCFRKSTQDAS